MVHAADFTNMAGTEIQFSTTDSSEGGMMKQPPDERLDNDPEPPLLSASFSNPASPDTTVDTQVETESSNHNDSNKDDVLYSDGATPLFLAIESLEWRQALEYAEACPAHVQTWILSTGTVHTTFSWSLWRRLPLHEACRRQAPAWLISSLLSIYPQACTQVTQFGSTPLHLAVESGSSPEVINLLICYDFYAIGVTDQSGRTPLQVLEESDLFDVVESRHVHASLQRATCTYRQMQSQHAHQLEDLARKHAKGLVAIQRQHEQDLLLEQNQLEGLIAQVESLQETLTLSHAAQQAQLQRIAHLEKLERLVRKQADGLAKKNQELSHGKKRENSAVVALHQVLQRKQDEMDALQSRIQELEAALQRVAQREIVQAKQVQAQECMQQLVQSMAALQQAVSGHADDMTSTLLELGIKPIVAVVEEKKEDLPFDGLEQEEEMADAALVAAMAATASLSLARNDSSE